MADQASDAGGMGRWRMIWTVASIVVASIIALLGIGAIGEGAAGPGIGLLATSAIATPWPVRLLRRKACIAVGWPIQLIMVIVLVIGFAAFLPHPEVVPVTPASQAIEEPVLPKPAAHHVARDIASKNSTIKALAQGPACIKDGAGAVTKINKELLVLVDNTTVDCVLLPDSQVEKNGCSLICVSENSMTDAQRRAILVWLTGAVGKEVNDGNLTHSGNVNYMDRDLGSDGVGMTMPLSTAATLQHLAFTDQLDANAMIASVEAAFKKRVVTKRDQ